MTTTTTTGLFLVRCRRIIVAFSLGFAWFRRVTVAKFEFYGTPGTLVREGLAHP